MTEDDIVKTLFRLLRRSEDPSLQNHLDPVSSADWEALLGTSIRLAVAPLLYDRLRRKSYIDRMPVDISEALKLSYHNNAAKNLIVRTQLAEILSILEVHQIPVILLKGSALAFTVYANPACRMMSDLDIMVHESDIQRALSLLEQAGYQMSKPVWENPGHHLPALVRPGISLPVEVHWQLTSPGITRSISPKETWESVQSLSMFGNPVLTLSPGLTLFHICQHTAYQHLFANSAQSLCDIESILLFHNETVDWEMLTAWAERTCCTRGILLTLQLADEFLSVSLPTGIDGRIAAENIPAGMASAATDRLFISQELADSPPEEFLPMLKWWFQKGQKLIRLVRASGTQRHGSSKTGQHQSLLWFRRLFYLLMNYWEAAIGQLKNSDRSPGAGSNRILRTWLDIR